MSSGSFQSREEFLVRKYYPADKNIKRSQLTLSWRKSLSYRNQSTDLQSKSMDWFLYDTDLRHVTIK